MDVTQNFLMTSENSKTVRSSEKTKWDQGDTQKESEHRRCHLIIFCQGRIFDNVSVNLGLAILPLPLGTPTPSNALFVRTFRSSRPMIPLCLCEHIMVSPRISCFRRIFLQFACRRQPARLSHASVGLVFTSIFSANIAYFRTLGIKLPENANALV